MSLNLRIVSPEKVEFQGTIDRVKVPGESGEFEILVDHAPIISTLSSGLITFFDSDGKHEVKTTGGFIEVQKNNVSICGEL